MTKDRFGFGLGKNERAEAFKKISRFKGAKTGKVEQMGNLEVVWLRLFSAAIRNLVG